MFQNINIGFMISTWQDGKKLHSSGLHVKWALLVHLHHVNLTAVMPLTLPVHHSNGRSGKRQNHSAPPTSTAQKTQSWPLVPAPLSFSERGSSGSLETGSNSPLQKVIVFLSFMLAIRLCFSHSFHFQSSWHNSDCIWVLHNNDAKNHTCPL